MQIVQVQYKPIENWVQSQSELILCVTRETFFKAEQRVTENITACRPSFLLSFLPAIYSWTEGFLTSLVDAKCPRSAGVLICG